MTMPGLRPGVVPEMADLLVTHIEKRVDSIEDVSFLSLHLALADQILLMQRVGVTAAEIDAIITEAWNKIWAMRERAEDAPEQTHRNGSLYAC